MFKLQRLEITGFKSFADHTEVVFTGNGITAVVGPNGCGKSNVSDAISWVLGEQRAKSLRGGEMKDVVFQGSRNRKPSGMAEVVLHLVRDDETFDIDEDELEDIDEALSAFDENAVDIDVLEGPQIEADELVLADAASRTSENGFYESEFETEKVQAAQVGSVQTVERTIRTKRHWRPRPAALEFSPGESVSVTRRLYLSGESEYQLNGKTCRLRDIQDLFSGTGLSGSHYAIVEQGRIGQILSAKPSDRRSLIEEAAGISKFRTRQRAAESRLESARSNLSRITDIVSEIDKQANSLRRQAGKTRRFIALQEEYRILQRKVFAAEGSRFSALIDELEKAFEAAIEAETAIASKVGEGEAEFRLETENARSAEEALAEVRRIHAENALERDRAEREHRYQSEQIVALNNRSETLAREIDAAAERRDLLRSETERFREQESKEITEAEASRLVLIDAESTYAGKIEVVGAIESELEACRGSLLQHTAAVERFGEIERQLKLNLERSGQRLESLKREGMRAEESFAAHTTEAAKLAAELADEQAKLKGFEDEKKDLLAASADAREKLHKSEEELRRLQDEFSRNSHRLETLRELEERKAVYAPQVQRLFAEQKEIGVELRGVLADMLEVDQKAEKAVENLLGNFLQAVVVAADIDAKKVSEWTRKNAAGQIAVLVYSGPTNVNSNGHEKGKQIGELLGADEKLLTLLRSIFYRELSARLVEDISDAKPKAGELLVDADGNISLGGSLFVSGDPTVEGKNTSLLAFKRELTGLSRAVKKLEQEIERAKTTTEADRRALAEHEERTVDLQSLIIKIERGILTLEVHERNERQEIERAERHRQVVDAEAKQVMQELDETRSRAEEAAASGHDAEALRQKVREEMESISARLVEARSDSEAENKVLNEKRTLAATSGERRRSVQSAIRRLEAESIEISQRITAHEIEAAEAENRVSELRSSVSEIAGKITSADAAIELEKEEHAAALEAVKTAREKADLASEALAELNRRSSEVMNERAAVEIRKTEAVTELKNLNEKALQDLNVPLAELVETETFERDFELDWAKAEAESQRQRLEGFGAINMLALEELGETEERLTFLTAQRQDIVDSIAAAEEALKEIKERSRAKFKQAFEAVNTNFVQFFQELFGGGRGEMTLLESEDILEAGIEIVAQPPGKRLQNILLLSGGEKAMTAIALVLAIFKYRPSPFCLLDEVDAPLDDANVGRFVEKIAGMSERTQFIVITHNKRTMEAARALYGVTMQEAGVSKVVSVKFE